jgi:hypothetical protein
VFGLYPQYDHLIAFANQGTQRREGRGWRPAPRQDVLTSYTIEYTPWRQAAEELEETARLLLLIKDRPYLQLTNSQVAELERLFPKSI